jgi:hypothetical protein
MISSAPFLVLFFGKCTRCVKQRAEFHDKRSSVISSDSENTRIHTNGIHGTGLNTVAAIDTFQQVDIKSNRHFFRPTVNPLTSLYYDAFGRAIGLTHKTGNAFHGTIVMFGQTMSPTPTGGDFRLLFGIVPNV